MPVLGDPGIGNKLNMTKILIGIPTGEMARRFDFYDHFNMMDKPEGTLIQFSHGQSPAQNRNAIIRAALLNECTHILFIDDDMIVPANLLTALMKHDKDVVSGLYLMRNYPHQPIAFDEAFPSGKCKYMFLTDDKRGLIPIVNCGFGAVLVKIEVFKKLQDPWVTLGEIEKDGWCDDIAFFNKVREAGFELYCDFDMLVGHSLNVTLVPQFIDNKWVVSYITMTGHAISFAPAIPNQQDVDNEIQQELTCKQ